MVWFIYFYFFFFFGGFIRNIIWKLMIIRKETFIRMDYMIIYIGEISCGYCCAGFRTINCRLTRGWLVFIVSRGCWFQLWYLFYDTAWTLKWVTSCSFITFRLIHHGFSTYCIIYYVYELPTKQDTWLMDVDINCFTRDYFVLNAVAIRSIIREIIIRFK